MELKVWVDGIQRVICGVTNQTTCHEVIIALANAMGRTGRFTLIEKWRDVERPLPPNEFPALALQKWGEYASEVRLHLCQSDSDKKKVHREKQPKTVEKFAHNFSVPESAEPSSSIKRSSTFSGAHNLGMAPRSHHDQLASRLNPVSDKPRSSGLYQLPHSSSSSPSFAGPVPSPRRRISPNRTVSPLRPPSPRTVLNHSQVTSKSPHNIVRPLPNRPPSSNSNERYGNVNHHFLGNHEQLAPVRRERTRTPSDTRTNFNRSPYQQVSNEEQLSTIEHMLGGGSHSRSASLEIEEYDLDRNFPDILRDSNRTDRPSVHTEYKLEPEVNSVPDPEHARLVRLVAVQQDRLKTQESQINHVDTEISSLEEKEKEYEEQLEKLTSELVTLEQRQREEESEITQLETVSWQDELINSQKHGQQLKSQLSELLEKRKHCERQITDNKVKETNLCKTISDIKQELEADDKKKKENEVKQKSEIENLKSELASKLQDCDKMEKELQTVEEEIKGLEQSFAEKQKEIDKIEEELKEENIKSLEEPTASNDSLQPVKSEKGDGTSILKLLEGRLSPRPGTKLNSPQAFISSLSTKNPNGVWV